LAHFRDNYLGYLDDTLSGNLVKDDGQSLQLVSKNKFFKFIHFNVLNAKQ
jgi:hypothetical protein